MAMSVFVAMMFMALDAAAFLATAATYDETPGAATTVAAAVA